MGSRYSRIPQELRELDRWVCTSDRADVPKRPYTPFSQHPANVNKPHTWGRFSEAMESVEEGRYDYLGFVFADDGYVGVDIDVGFDEMGFPTEEALDFIKRCNSYTEISKRGHGFHIICKADLPFSGANDRHGWEVYKTARHFVLTGNVLDGFEDIADGSDAIARLLEERFSDDIEVEQEDAGPRIAKRCIWKPKWDVPSNGRIPLNPTYEKVASGARHLSLVSFCGQWINAGESGKRLLLLTKDANERYMVPPLPDEEVEQIVKSCAKYG